MIGPRHRSTSARRLLRRAETDVELQYLTSQRGPMAMAPNPVDERAALALHAAGRLAVRTLILQEPHPLAQGLQFGAQLLDLHAPFRSR